MTLVLRACNFSHFIYFYLGIAGPIFIGEQKMTSSMHVHFVADAAQVQGELASEIKKAEHKSHTISFFVMAPSDYVNEKSLGTIIKRVLSETNSRFGVDRIIREAEKYAYFVSLGANVSYTLDLTERLQKDCDLAGIKIVGSVMYLPKNGTVEQRAREVYDCLSEGIADHRRKLPVIYPLNG
jgi:hypothetical protein